MSIEIPSGPPPTLRCPDIGKDEGKHWDGTTPYVAFDTVLVDVLSPFRAFRTFQGLLGNRFGAPFARAGV